jgi:hypothetical protein
MLETKKRGRESFLRDRRTLPARQNMPIINSSLVLHTPSTPPLPPPTWSTARDWSQCGSSPHRAHQAGTSSPRTVPPSSGRSPAPTAKTNSPGSRTLSQSALSRFSSGVAPRADSREKIMGIGLYIAIGVVSATVTSRALRLSDPWGVTHVTARENERKRAARNWGYMSHELRCGRELLCRGEGARGGD